jgi:hypothetical protein
MLGDYFELNPNKICKKRVSNRLNREEKAIRDPVPAGLLTFIEAFFMPTKIFIIFSLVSYCEDKI